MSRPTFSAEIRDKAATITGKRARVIVDHILEHGSITTEDLENYGYKHPPRAIRDVREQGMPLDQFWTKNSTGRKIAGYRFADPSTIRNDRLGGRQVLPKQFRATVFGLHESRCNICRAKYESRYLQLDHRVPFEVGGDTPSPAPTEYMPLCGSCNSAKTRSCQDCTNWTATKDPAVCGTCYWARPESYTHIALQAMRRLDIVWQGEEVKAFESVERAADEAHVRVPDFVKDVLKRALGGEPG